MMWGRNHVRHKMAHLPSDSLKLDLRQFDASFADALQFEACMYFWIGSGYDIAFYGVIHVWGRNGF